MLCSIQLANWSWGRSPKNTWSTKVVKFCHPLKPFLIWLISLIVLDEEHPVNQSRKTLSPAQTLCGRFSYMGGGKCSELKMVFNLIQITIKYFFYDVEEEEVERIRSILEETNKCYFCEYKAPVPWIHPSKGDNLSGMDIWDHVWSVHPQESEWFAWLISFSPNTEAWALSITLEISILSGLVWITLDWLCWAVMRPMEVDSIKHFVLFINLK